VLLDVSGERSHRAEDLSIVTVVSPELQSVLSLHRQGQLEGIDRIEAQALDEEGSFDVDVLRPNVVEHQRFHDKLADFLLEGVVHGDSLIT
jgi:hypothetical protein